MEYTLLNYTVKNQNLISHLRRKNTQRRRLKGGTLLPERHERTQTYALQQNSVPTLETSWIQGILSDERKLELSGLRRLETARYLWLVFVLILKGPR
jgi:hypothetical protein